MSKKIKTLKSQEVLDEVHAETAQEMAERLQKEVDAYKEMVSTKETQEELDELEREIMKEMDAYDEYIKGVRYALPESTTFEGKMYTRSAVADKITYFISKIEQSWQYVLGLYELCKYWKSNASEIAFGPLDSTLRLLDQCKFQGMTEWRDILVVNEYMKALHEQYAKDTTHHIALAQRHNAIIQQRDLITPINEGTTDEGTKE